jgi:subtilisin family serine protease
MRRLILASLAIGSATAAMGAAAPSMPMRPFPGAVPSGLATHAHAPGPRFAPGEVLVALDPVDPLKLGADRRVTSPDAGLAAVLSRHGLDRYMDLPGRAPSLAQSRTRFIKLMSSRPDFDPVAAARELRATSGVRAAVPNYSVQLASTLPNDPYLGTQWAIQDSIDADIQLPEAWDLEKGSASTVIAILDLGVDTGHPDLVTKIWANTGEIHGNLIDDDGNGLVDDVEGWDFGDGDKDPNPHAVYDEIGLDEGFHGTFVAGIAAAATDNATGIAGAGWNCKVMPLKMVATDGSTRLDAVTGGFQYATDKHADVLSMSFTAKPDSGVAEYFQALVDQAVAAGVICVAAAGNDSTDSLRYPAACANVIAVAASDSLNTSAWFTNWGSWVDVAAPGEGIWSTICRNYPVDFGSQLFYVIFFGWDGVNPYMYADGTSMSCPLVAGVCGLLRSRMPTITPQQVEGLLIATGDAIASDHPFCVKVNAFQALNAAAVAAESRPPATLRLYGASPNPFVEATALRFALPQSGNASLAIYNVAGRRVRELARGVLSAGPHSAAWDGRDADGRRLASGFYFARLESAGSVATARVLLLR